MAGAAELEQHAAARTGSGDGSPSALGTPGAHWHTPLRRALDAVPPARRRRIRTLLPAAGASLGSGAGDGERRCVLDLASNDYLGLSRHPAVGGGGAAPPPPPPPPPPGGGGPPPPAAAGEGVGAGASRLVSGSRPVHAELEAELAAWLGRERALLFPSGFQANLAAVLALADRHSLVLADRLIHHSLLTGVAASGARLRRFRHNDLAHLEELLAAARRARPGQRLLVLSESLFSMEGTSPDVPALAALCERYGAALLLDEAHALGVLGPGGRGLGHGTDSIALISGTFGKAFGSGGAVLAGGALVMEWLLQSSGAFRYTTALAPPLAAGALAALRLIQRRHGAGDDPAPAVSPTDLLLQARRWRDALEAAGWPRPPGTGPILPLVVGSDERALELQRRLEEAGLLAGAIRPPTVPEGGARLRLVLRADLPAGTLARLLRALGSPGAL